MSPFMCWSSSCLGDVRFRWRNIQLWRMFLRCVQKTKVNMVPSRMRESLNPIRFTGYAVRIRIWIRIHVYSVNWKDTQLHTKSSLLSRDNVMFYSSWKLATFSIKQGLLGITCCVYEWCRKCACVCVSVCLYYVCDHACVCICACMSACMCIK
jgi:hypothetical protein